MSSQDTDQNVQDTLKAASDSIENLLALAVTQEEEITKLKKANSDLQGQKVILEKVAEEKPSAPSVTPERVDNLVDELVSLGYISNDESEKFASELKKSPDSLVKLASSIIRINNPSNEGTGVPRQENVKKASITSDWEQDGWTECFKN